MEAQLQVNWLAAAATQQRAFLSSPAIILNLNTNKPLLNLNKSSRSQRFAANASEPASDHP
jgi:hypothetical protein